MSANENDPVEITEGKGQYRYYRDGSEGKVWLSAGTFARLSDWVENADVDHGIDAAPRNPRVAEAETKDPSEESDEVIVDRWGEHRSDEGEVGRRVEFILYLYEGEIVVGEMSPCDDGWNSNRSKINELEREIRELRQYVGELEAKIEDGQ